MAPDYNTLPMSGHIVGRASEKKSSVWRVIAEIVAFVVEGGIRKKRNVRWRDATLCAVVRKTCSICGGCRKHNKTVSALCSSSQVRDKRVTTMLKFILQIPILPLQALMLLIVVAGCYVIFLIGRRASQAKAEKIQNIFSLKPGAVSQEIRWDLPPVSSGAQVIGQVISALQRQGARALRQEGPQAVLYFGSRIRAKMWGIRFADPVTWPTRVLARAEMDDNATTLRVRMDEDYGYQMFIGSWFQDGYGKMFAVVVETLEKELGPSGRASSHPL
jgi:hypothetical protein